jgi:hypothetical protein
MQCVERLVAIAQHVGLVEVTAVSRDVESLDGTEEARAAVSVQWAPLHAGSSLPALEALRDAIAAIPPSASAPTPSTASSSSSSSSSPSSSSAGTLSSAVPVSVPASPSACFASTFVAGQDVAVDFFRCVDCKLNWVCRACAESGCHRHHTVVPFAAAQRPLHAHCYCFKQGKKCTFSPKGSAAASSAGASASSSTGPTGKGPRIADSMAGPPRSVMPPLSPSPSPSPLLQTLSALSGGQTKGNGKGKGRGPLIGGASAGPPPGVLGALPAALSAPAPPSSLSSSSALAAPASTSTSTSALVSSVPLPEGFVSLAAMRASVPVAVLQRAFKVMDVAVMETLVKVWQRAGGWVCIQRILSILSAVTDRGVDMDGHCVLS